MKNSEFEAKARFVWLQLGPALSAATAGAVRRAAYEACEGEETVVLEYAGGYQRRVNVTGDSLLALARDVLGAVS